jgi:hypothetical protein
MIHGMLLSTLLDDDKARAPLNDIGSVSYFPLLDNSLSGFDEPAFCHIKKDGPGLIFIKKYLEFLFR